MVAKSKGEMLSMSCAFLSCSLIRKNGAGKDFYVAHGKNHSSTKNGPKNDVSFLSEGNCSSWDLQGREPRLSFTRFMQ